MIDGEYNWENVIGLGNMFSTPVAQKEESLHWLKRELVGIFKNLLHAATQDWASTMWWQQSLPFSIWGFWLLCFHLLRRRGNRSVTAGQRVIPLLYTWWIKIYICLTLKIFSFETPHQIFQVLISLDIALVACPTSADTLLSARDHRQGRRGRNWRRRRGD